jgi:hypothetical protein
MSILNTLKQNSFQLCVSFFVMSLYVLLNGYDFNTGDQAEHLPQVYQMFDPSLYPNDFFLSNYRQTFTVRHYWVQIVYFLSHVFSIRFSCLVLYFFCMYFTILAWTKIIELFQPEEDKTGKQNFYVFIALMLIFIIANSFTLGGNYLLGKIFIGSTIAELFASWGIYLFFKNNYMVSAIFFALSVWFQALVGLQLFLVFAGILFFTFEFNNIKSSIIRLVTFSIVFIIFSLPLLGPLLYAQKLNNQGLDNQLFYDLLYFKRAPWHYVPSTFPKLDYSTFFGLLFFGLIPVITIKPNKMKTQTLWLFAIILSVCAFYFVAFYTHHFMWIGKLQWFKTTIWVNVFACIFIARFVSAYIPSFQLKVIDKLLLASSSAMLVFMFYSDAYTDSSKYAFLNDNPKTDIQKLHTFIKENTNKDARFLIPIDNESFTSEAQRSTVASFKAVVHEPFFFVKWQKVLEQFYQVDFNSNISPKMQAIENYCKTCDTLAFVDYNYRIDNTKESSIIPRLKNRVITIGDWTLTKVK